MRGLARALCSAAIATLWLLSPAAASAAGLSNENLVASGSLVYSWHGDSSRGCAAAGVCNVQGELILRPAGEGQVFVFGRNQAADINLEVSGAVRVLRGGANPGECVDLPQTSIGLDIRLSSTRATTAVLSAPADSGRCAGPLESELANMRIPFRHGGRRGPFDLSTSRSFAAGPFSGSFLSTLALRPAPNGGLSSSSSFGSGSSPGPRHAVLEQAQLSYRVAVISNEIQTHFNGASDSSCQILDACGTSGSLALLVSGPATFTVEGSRLVHGRRSRERVLADLSHGRLTLDGATPVNGYVNESYDWSDGSNCRDSVPTPQLQFILGSPGPLIFTRHLPVGLLGDLGPNVEMLRTHCPGPGDADLIGQNGILASGSVMAGELLHRRLTVTLTQPSGFVGLGYTGSPSGSIRFELTLVKVHVQATAVR